MNPKEIVLALKSKIQAIERPDTTPLFHPNSVVVVPGQPHEDALARLIMPICLIHPGARQNDEEQPSLFEMDIEVVIINSVPGDPLGANALMGANGVLGNMDIDILLMNVVSFLNAREGIIIKAVSGSASGWDQLNKIAWLAHQVEHLKAKGNYSPNPAI